MNLINYYLKKIINKEGIEIMKREEERFNPKKARLKAILSNYDIAEKVTNLTYREGMNSREKQFENNHQYSGYDIWCPDRQSNNRIITVIQIEKRNKKSIWYRIIYVGYHCTTNNIADNREIKNNIRSTELFDLHKAEIETDKYGNESIYDKNTGIFIETNQPEINQYWLWSQQSWSI